MNQPDPKYQFRFSIAADSAHFRIYVRGGQIVVGDIGTFVLSNPEFISLWNALKNNERFEFVPDETVGVH